MLSLACALSSAICLAWGDLEFDTHLQLAGERNRERNKERARQTKTGLLYVLFWGLLLIESAAAATSASAAMRNINKWLSDAFSVLIRD